MNTITITDYNAVAVADAINAAFAADDNATVNGEKLFTRWGAPAQAYQNGTVAVAVPARTVKGRPSFLYFKPGTTVEIAA